MLLSSFEHSVDNKGRVFVPAKMRDILGEKFIVTRGIGHCLFVFSMEKWDELCEKLRTLPLTDQDSQKFVRLLLAFAVECEPDKQGRVLIPQMLRDYAELTESAVVLGLMSRAEIWSPKNWQAYVEGADNDYDTTLLNLAGKGI